MRSHKQPAVLDQRKKATRFLFSLLLVNVLIGLTVAGNLVYAGNDQVEKPILLIQLYYDNPCSSCPTVSDFEELVRKSAQGWSDKVSVNIFSYPTYTTDGYQKLQKLLDEHKVPHNERFYNEVALVGNQLLLDDFEIGLPPLLATEAERLLASIDSPKVPEKPTSFQEQTETQKYSADMIFLSSDSCANCKKAEILVEEIEEKTNLTILRYDVVHDAPEFRAIVDRFQIDSPTVPVLIYQDNVWVGYNPVIVQEIRAAVGLDKSPDEQRFLLWNIDEVPLVFSTILIGLTDGFNPCSLWALLFVVSMMMRFQSRKIMLTVGLTYVLVVTIVYGLFIIGLFGVVTYIVNIIWLRVPLFAFACLFGAVNIYSFFVNRDPLVSISDENKKRFVQQIRARLYAQTTLPGLIVATVLIALLASLIELPCTAGFPVIWSAILTEHGVGPAVYFPLLGLYLLMYVVDELIIVLLMAYTMKKLFINQTIGRSLKFVSGLLMVYLAFVLLLGNEYLNSTLWVVGGSVVVIIMATILTFVLKKLHVGS